jgi:hypothetical protein
VHKGEENFMFAEGKSERKDYSKYPGVDRIILIWMLIIAGG